MSFTKNIRIVLNLALYLGFALIIGSGLLLYFKLPPGFQGGGGLSCLGWTRHQWEQFHAIVAFVWTTLLIIHLIFNWNWIYNIICRNKVPFACLFVLVGIVLTISFLFLPISQKDPQRQQRRQGRKWQQSVFYMSGPIFYCFNQPFETRLFLSQAYGKDIVRY